VNQNHRRRLHHSSTKLEENFFLSLQSHFQRIGNNILFLFDGNLIFVKNKEIASFCATAPTTLFLLYLFFPSFESFSQRSRIF